MEDKSSDPRESLLNAALVKGEGSTPAERYLAKLCERGFLHLWSYPRPHRDEGGGKEICDLLVVFGDDVLIFSDKHCVLQPRKTLDIDWKRWFKAAVVKGARQAWGAEAWLKQHPDRVFVDPRCRQRIPVKLPDPAKARYHLIVTVHGVARACRAMLGGSGSLMLRSDLRGFAEHVEPFVIGDLDPLRTPIHVYDDTSLDIVLRMLDTTPDFLEYINAKERLFRSRAAVHAAGEEEVLGLYLRGFDGRRKGEAFDVPDDLDLISIDEGVWAEFITSDARRAQKEHDRISYAWDRLINKFAKHALDQTQYFATEPAFESSERVLRAMASEPRLNRRALAKAFLGMLEQTPSDQRGTRVVLPLSQDGPTYVFLAVPWFDSKAEEEQRVVRREFLQAALMVTKLNNPQIREAVGSATESGIDTVHRTEDAIYFDATGWTEEDDRQAAELQEELGLLKSPKMWRAHDDEFPLAFIDGSLRVPPGKNPRNKPCPCGSGVKYKRCHGRS